MNTTSETVYKVRRSGNRPAVEPNKIQIPDCWHIANRVGKVEGEDSRQAVLETWHLAHDLKEHAIGCAEMLHALQFVLEYLDRGDDDQGHIYADTLSPISDDLTVADWIKQIVVKAEAE